MKRVNQGECGDDRPITERNASDLRDRELSLFLFEDRSSQLEVYAGRVAPGDGLAGERISEDEYEDLPENQAANTRKFEAMVRSNPGMRVVVSEGASAQPDVSDQGRDNAWIEISGSDASEGEDGVTTSSVADTAETVDDGLRPKLKPCVAQWGFDSARPVLEQCQDDAVKPVESQWFREPKLPSSC